MNIYQSIARAKEFHDIDESMIIILDEKFPTWLSYVKYTNTLLFYQVDKKITFSEEAEKNLRNWIMPEITG